MQELNFQAHTTRSEEAEDDRETLYFAYYVNVGDKVSKQKAKEIIAELGGDLSRQSINDQYREKWIIIPTTGESRVELLYSKAGRLRVDSRYG